MFTKEILDKAQRLSLSELIGPSTPVAENETVLGVLPEELKRLWVIFREMGTEESRKREEIMTRHPLDDLDDLGDAEMEELARTLAAMTNKMKIISSIFWAELRLAFPEGEVGETAAGSIGVRENFAVVAIKESSPLESLASLFGGSFSVVRL